MGFQIGNIVKSVYAKLNSDTTLDNLISNIYVSSMPKNATYPCIVIGDNDLIETPFNVFGKKGKDSILNIYIYDSSNSDLTNIGVAERVDTLLDWKDDLSIDSNNHVKTAIQTSTMGYDLTTVEGTELRFVKLQYKITTDET